MCPRYYTVEKREDTHTVPSAIQTTGGAWWNDLINELSAICSGCSGGVLSTAIACIYLPLDSRTPRPSVVRSEIVLAAITDSVS